MSVTTDQLKSLADLLNERRAEWNFSLNPLSLGEVRSIYDAYGVWWQDLAKQKAEDSWDAYKEGYASGLYDAEEAARDKAAEAALKAKQPQTYGGIEVPAEFMASDEFIDSTDYPDRDGKPSIYESYWQGYDEDEAAEPDDYDPMLDFGSDDPNAPATPLSREVNAAAATAAETGVETQADLIHDLKQHAKDVAAEFAGLDKPYDKVVAATLGPEHTLVTPLRPIGRDRLPDPDVARGRLAHAIAAGSDETRELVSLATRKPRTLAEVDAKGRRGWNGNELPTIQDMVAELKRQSMAGMMPSQSQFNDAKPANWAVATAQLQRLNTSWEELAELAGLKRRQPGPQAQSQAA